jgi:hypothetical protein
MSNIDGKLIDRCSQYITGKGCHYLAKEGQVVYFASITGRKSDYAWHKSTPTECMRILKSMHMNFTEAGLLREGHLIAAFQELGLVYEYGVSSQHKVKEGIFNYLEHSETSIADSIIIHLIKTLEQKDYRGLILGQVCTLNKELQSKLNCDLGAAGSRVLIIKHWEAAGWEIKTGSQRPLVFGKKTPAIIKLGYKPADVKPILGGQAKDIIKEVIKELK